jgi:Uma2 family endonuclease
MAESPPYVAWISELFPPQGQWTEADYFTLPDSSRIIELSDGHILMAPPPTPEHQRIVKRLAFALDQFVRSQSLGEVFIAPIAVRLREGKIREPDILFLSADHLNRAGEQIIDGTPDWVAEVISPGSRHTDEVDKLKEYAEAEIPEYWLLDGRDKTIRVYRLDQLISIYRSGQMAYSETISGFEVAVDEVFSL